jgi:hypothetical protein
MGKQIYGWTTTETPPSGKYVSYINAHVEPDGKVTVTIRDPDSRHNTIILSPEEAATLATSINTAVFPFLKSARGQYEGD